MSFTHSREKRKAEQLEVTDPRAMRALAHPARLAILAHLQLQGQATATECAEVAGESPSSCSYHLRTLARWGLVEQAESADGRERPWRPRARGMRWSVEPDAPEQLAASRLLTKTFLERDLAQLKAYTERADELPGEWGELAYNQSSLLVTRDELIEISEQISDLLDRYIPRNRRRSAPKDARLVNFFALGYPRVDR
jgi:DNA-binding transcriptional ArsR family regulator